MGIVIRVLVQNPRVQVDGRRVQSPWARRTDDGWTNESRGDAAIRQITAAIFVLCDDEILGGKLFEVTSEHH